MREIIGGIVLNAVRLFRPFAFVLMLAAVGCHAQAPSAGGGKLPPELARRVEILDPVKGESASKLRHRHRTADTQ